MRVLFFHSGKHEIRNHNKRVAQRLPLRLFLLRKAALGRTSPCRPGFQQAELGAFERSPRKGGSVGNPFWLKQREPICAVSNLGIDMVSFPENHGLTRGLQASPVSRGQMVLRCSVKGVSCNPRKLFHIHGRWLASILMSVRAMGI